MDNTAVHPERYALVQRMAKDAGASVEELIRNKELRRSIPLERYATEDCGLPTLNDIMSELDKPGRDPRSKIKAFSFDPNVHTMDDLKEGMVLPGIISNITNFGCFVDIGVHEKGLVHISQLADRLCERPERSRFAPSTGERARAAGGQGTQTDCIIIENLMNL